jgi:hypothetical protein
MATIFSLITPQDEQQEQEYLAYMKQKGLLPSDDFRFGRVPTYGELKQILSRLPQYTAARFEYDMHFTLANGEEWTL